MALNDCPDPAYRKATLSLLTPREQAEIIAEMNAEEAGDALAALEEGEAGEVL